MATKKFYIVSYDIVENKKRTRVANILEDFGTRVQKSVFECRLETDKFNEMHGKLKAAMDTKTDSILFYLLCDGCIKQKSHLGYKIIGAAEAKDYGIL